MDTQSVKNITSIEELLFLFDSLINDGNVITVLSVKNSLKLPSDLSQKFMQYYFEQRKDQLNATYLVEGYSKDNNEYICAIFNEKEILELQKEQNNYSTKIYSIQSNKSNVDLSLLWKQELNELNRMFETIDLKSQLLIPEFSEIILGDLKVKNKGHNLYSQPNFLQNNKEVKDNDRKINVKEINHKEDKEVNDANKNIRITEEPNNGSRTNDGSIKIHIKKENHTENKEKHSENKELKASTKNENSKSINSVYIKNSNLNNDTKEFKQSSNLSHKRKINNDDYPFKIKRENLLGDSMNNEINKSLDESNVKTTNKIQHKENEMVPNNIQIKKEEKINETNKNKIENKSRKKLEIAKKDAKPKLFQSDSSEDDTENKASEQNEEPLKTFPKIKSVKETQLFYENGYLVTVDKDSCIHVDSPESSKNESNKVKKEVTPPTNKKRKSLQQTLLTNFFKKKIS